MSALTDATVEDLLKTELKKCIGDYKVAWPNAAFKTVTGTPYYRAFFLGVPPERIGYGNTDRHTGILQVDAVVPARTGITTPLTMARAVAVQFDRGKIMSGTITIRVIKSPAVGTPLSEVDWYYIPVSVTYTLLT